MTRINTNVSSLNAQKSLARTNAQLQQALTRLSTGLRINVGKDDPAGLIASEMLGGDIVSTQKAISNSQQANQMISTADSALGQISSLLSDIRGLVDQAANKGALSADQIAANQLQIDSSLDAINRVAQTTTFQGRKLLDGSLDFITEGTGNFNQVGNLAIHQANLGTTNSLSVNAAITSAATQAEVDISNVPAATEAANAHTDLAMDNTVVQADSGAIALTSTGETVQVAAVAGEAYDGNAGNLSVRFVVDGTLGSTATAAVADGVLTIKVKDGNTTLTNIKDAVDGIKVGGNSVFLATVSTGGTKFNTLDNGTQGAMTGGRTAGTATIRVTADTAGVDANGVTVTLSEDGTVDNAASAELNSGGDILVHVKGIVSHAAIAAAIDGLAGYSAALIGETGGTNYDATLDTAPGAATMANGVDAAGGLAHDVVFSVAGETGSQVFSFSAGASITQMKNAIAALKDSTGVDAAISGTTLQLKSTGYGSDASVQVKVVSEAAGGTVTASVGQGTRDTGTDIAGNINGITATGKGNMLSLNTSALAVDLTASAGFTGNIGFNISGGGALFQLGPEVVTSQQARLGVQSVDTTTLGGVSGKLYQLASGQVASLATSVGLAATIVNEATTAATTLRGRLGAFQKTTVDTNIAALSDTVTALTDAQSSIRDADFAAETANLQRAQILSQSGMAVLSIANQRPQNVLTLLRNL
jgi:flagellin